MTRSKWIVVVVVLLLLAMVPVLAMAQGRDGVVTAKFTRGQAFQAPVSNVPKAAAPAVGLKAVLPRTPAQKLGLAPAAVTFRVREGFEGLWPNDGWDTYDLGNYPGDYCWDDENWIAYKGNWSAWAAGGCADGLDPNFDYYVDDMESIATLGPFNTENATHGRLNFRYWNNSEEGWDYFLWCASVDNIDFYCNGHTGSTNDRWRVGRLDLANVPGYGSMLGYSDVWIGFAFFSDSIISFGYDGPFIDQVALKVRN